MEMNAALISKRVQSVDPLEWKREPSAAEWDHALAALAGHPLQSALWGESRRMVDGTRDCRWMALRNNKPVWLARIEQRRLPCGWIGWIPRGPTGDMDGKNFPAVVRDELRREGMVLLVTDRWVEQTVDPQPRNGSSVRTIWIDLSAGREAVWKSLDKQWRYGVGRARRLGVTVDVATHPDEIAQFAALCSAVADRKGFDLPGSKPLMEELLRCKGGEVEGRLFLARLKDGIRAGAFIIRCGRSLHYFWGCTDRSTPQVRAGEAVHWAAIEWGLAMGCTRYDLEGIDPHGNPGTYKFKKKMGGTEVALSGKRYIPIGTYGRIASWLAARLG
jgi:hypothetical protein